MAHRINTVQLRELTTTKGLRPSVLRIKKGARLVPLAFIIICVSAMQLARVSAAVVPKEVMIIVNDASPTSRAIGEAYTWKRQVKNILHVRCKDSAVLQEYETIDFGNYLAEIETPLRAFLRTHPHINFIVTTKGIPIRISGAAVGEGYSGTTETSLDSYLASLDYDKLPGAVKVFFNAGGGGAIGAAWLNRYWNANTPFSHKEYGGFLVTRLDGYTEADAQSLIHRAVTADLHFRQGIVLLDVEPDFGLGDKHSQPAPITEAHIVKEDSWDKWNADMEHAYDDLMKLGIPVELNTKREFIGDRGDLGGYFSWGSNDDHFSWTAYRSLTFLPGALGDTAVSSSARSFFPQTEGQSLIGDLISQGITGVKGYTDEPLLQAVSSPTIVLDRYLSGYTLAESFYAGSHFVGWTDIVIGDPLTCPYRMRAASKPDRNRR